MKTIYAVYKGDNFLYMGTIKQCAKHFGVTEKTVNWWATPAAHKREEKSRNLIVAERLKNNKIYFTFNNK